MAHTLLTLLTPLAALALGGLAGAQIRLVDTLPGTFVDISSTGTAVTPVQDGEFDLTTSIGNALLPAGVVRVATNGGARFDPQPFGEDLPAANQPVPNVVVFGGSRTLLPYWDDFGGATGALGTIHHQEVNGTLIIQWTDVHLRTAPTTSRVTFQLQVPSSGAVFARFVYADIEESTAGGVGATIGFQGPTSAQCAQHSFNANHSVRNGTVLSLVDVPAFALLSGVPGEFIDIAATGTPLTLGGDGAALHVTAVRNALVQQGEVLIGMNGGVRLGGTGTLLTGVNAALPSALAFGGGQALLPFWDDLDTLGGTAGRVFVEERPDRLIVQWDDVTFFANTSNQRVTFQLQVFDDSDLLAQFVYEDVEGPRAARGGSATVGYQAGGVLSDLQHSFNQQVLSNGTVLSLYRRSHIGANYCVATPNSTGALARIEARGSDVVAENALALHAEALPTQSAAFFLVATTPTLLPNAGGSQGNLCVGGVVGRGVGGIRNSGTTGTVDVTADLTAMPSPSGLFAITAGSTFNFQCWFRDSVGGLATSNLTDAVQVRFRP